MSAKKRQQTMAKMRREQAVKERRARKQQKKEEAAAARSAKAAESTLSADLGTTQDEVADAPLIARDAPAIATEPTLRAT